MQCKSNYRNITISIENIITCNIDVTNEASKWTLNSKERHKWKAKEEKKVEDTMNDPKIK